MSTIDFKFSQTDNDLANFAKALALPIRVAIIRTIMANGNSITRENFYDIPFHHETINKHVAELKNLGIIKASGYKGNIKYCVDESLFNQMAAKFTLLLSGFNNWALQLHD